ncbi:MAG: arsenical resistance operon transcriptional repressor ArsD [Firmicutes bacterium HGW-Firmicutes-14]|nr:MAG: arsenical resistance operon transcriptional repressor ArsD [Firmicutes bacterium HGW-Firmicutes-14]
MKVEFFEPPMCCSTGLCGPAPDKTLVRLNQDINNLKEKYPGIIVERYMITQQPLKFRDNEEVYRLVKENSKVILPITTLNGKVINTHRYPALDEIVEAIEGETK